MSNKKIILGIFEFYRIFLVVNIWVFFICEVILKCYDKLNYNI